MIQKHANSLHARRRCVYTTNDGGYSHGLFRSNYVQSHKADKKVDKEKGAREHIIFGTDTTDSHPLDTYFILKAADIIRW